MVRYLFWLRPVLQEREGDDQVAMAAPVPVPVGPRRPAPSRMITNNPGAEAVPGVCRRTHAGCRSGHRRADSERPRRSATRAHRW